jgi:drug/metabolite transporter (DMT)-like permease
MTTIESVLSLLMLSGFIWVVGFLLPRARREHSRFAVICSLIAALAALIGWLFISVGTRSR